MLALRRELSTVCKKMIAIAKQPSNVAGVEAYDIDDPEYQRYHDEEWGVVQRDDRVLFEKLCLESFQSGLSWRTILAKRENFRRAFHQFDFAKGY